MSNKIITPNYSSKGQELILTLTTARWGFQHERKLPCMENKEILHCHHKTYQSLWNKGLGWWWWWGRHLAERLRAGKYLHQPQAEKKCAEGEGDLFFSQFRSAQSETATAQFSIIVPRCPGWWHTHTAAVGEKMCCDDSSKRLQEEEERNDEKEEVEAL